MTYSYERAVAEVEPHIDRLVEEKVEAEMAKARAAGQPDFVVEAFGSTVRESWQGWREAAIAQAARALTHPDAPCVLLQ